MRSRVQQAGNFVNRPGAANGIRKAPALSTRRTRFLGVLAAGLTLTYAVLAPAQMVSPKIDAASAPFSYYSHPTDEIGVMDAPAGTLVSPEGFLYTGFGELMFFTGNPERAIHQRVKMLLRGYLPEIRYSCLRNGIRYQFTVFAATLNGQPSGVLIDFVRVRMENTTTERRTAWFSTGMRYEGEVDSTDGVANNRYSRPQKAARLGNYSQVGAVYNPNWKYSSDGHTVERDGQPLYYFPANLPHTVRFTLRDDPAPAGILQPQVLQILPTTPVGIVQYKISLQPGQQQTLDFKLPVVPIAKASPEFEQVESASFDAYLSRVSSFWENVLKDGIDINVPEAKVNDAFKANLIYDLIAREHVGNDYVQTVNDLHYHAFWLRDASFIAHMYDLTGYPKYARQVLDFFAQWQQPDGNFVSQGGQFDGVGQVLWAYGQHYQITHDRNFAEKVYPSVLRAVEWINRARQTDPMHLMPSTRPGDNENISGHVTGHNFWALDGLRNAAVIATAAGHDGTAEEIRRDYADYLSTFEQVLDNVTKHSDGYIPPGLDGQHGQDWGNMMAAYPESVLSPDDPLVTATLKATRAKYAEGIMTYSDGGYLHGYLGFTNTETEILRGEQQQVISDLYAELLHTSSTHAGFETDIRPWGNRDFDDNLSPHGWFAARLRICLRNMLVREEEQDLHLLSAISPEWIKVGRSITVSHAATRFGTVDLDLKQVTPTHAELSFHSSFQDPPKRILLHLPWFTQTEKVVADGRNLPIHSNAVELPLHVGSVSIEWKKKPGTVPVSYDRAVRRYKQEYARRYEQFLQTGRQ